MNFFPQCVFHSWCNRFSMVCKLQDFLFLFSFHDILLIYYLLKKNRQINIEFDWTSIVFNFISANNTILSCFFFLFLYNCLVPFNSCSDYTNIYSYCRTCNTNRNTTNEANAEIETQQVTVKAGTIKFSTI